MTSADVLELLLVIAAAVVAPLVATSVRRFAMPAVVLEIAFGILLGPQVLGLVKPTAVTEALATLGLSMLMFLAGYELRLRSIRGRPLKLGIASWCISLVLAAGVGYVLHLVGGHSGEIVVPLALTTTALGTLLPVLRDAGVLHTEMGRYTLALGSVGEFGPILLIGLLLAGDDTVKSLAFLAGFAVLIVASALLASRTWNEGVVSAISRGLTSSSQLPVRMTMLFMLALTAVAIELGLDVLIGAFAAGIVARIASGGHDEEDETVSSTIYANKLEGIGFGMLVPVFFVLSGVAIDVRSLVQDPEVLVLVPVFLVLMLIVRAVPTFICYRHALDGEDRRALSVLSAAGLPLIVVITTIAVENGYLGSADAAAMVAAGMLSVLVFPAIALAMLGRKQSVPSEPGSGL